MDRLYTLNSSEIVKITNSGLTINVDLENKFGDPKINCNFHSHLFLSGCDVLPKCDGTFKYPTPDISPVCQCTGL